VETFFRHSVDVDAIIDCFGDNPGM